MEMNWGLIFKRELRAGARVLVRVAAYKAVFESGIECARVRGLDSSEASETKPPETAPGESTADGYKQLNRQGVSAW